MCYWYKERERSTWDWVWRESNKIRLKRTTCKCSVRTTSNDYQLPTTNYQLPTTSYQLDMQLLNAWRRQAPHQLQHLTG